MAFTKIKYYSNRAVDHRSRSQDPVHRETFSHGAGFYSSSGWHPNAVFLLRVACVAVQPTRHMTHRGFQYLFNLSLYTLIYVTHSQYPKLIILGLQICSTMVAIYYMELMFEVQSHHRLLCVQLYLARKASNYPPRVPSTFCSTTFLSWGYKCYWSVTNCLFCCCVNWHYYKPTTPSSYLLLGRALHCPRITFPTDSQTGSMQQQPENGIQ